MTCTRVAVLSFVGALTVLGVLTAAGVPSGPPAHGDVATAGRDRADGELLADDELDTGAPFLLPAVDVVRMEIDGVRVDPADFDPEDGLPPFDASIAVWQRASDGSIEHTTWYALGYVDELP